MKLAVLSGKGGTGKTFLSVNLAAAGNASYIDCDAEEPNGELFLRTKSQREREVFVRVPEFDEKKCTGCRRCVKFCRFHALAFTGGKPMLFSQVCHFCGGCALVCPAGAVKERKRPVGIVRQGEYKGLCVTAGVLNTGEASAAAVVKKTLEAGLLPDKDAVIDCPAGTGCSVMEVLKAADFCALAAEPTAFGFHDFKMAYTLVRLFKKPCLVIINKETAPYPPLEDFCIQEGLSPPAHIPQSGKAAKLCAEGLLACEREEEYAQMFGRLWRRIKEEASV